MIFKNSLLLISLLLGVVVTTVSAYSEYDDETTSHQSENSQNFSHNQEIFNPDLLQSQAESLLNMDMHIGVDTKAEVTLKNVRNISDNQLSNEFNAPMQHGNEKHPYADMAKEVEEQDETPFIPSTEQSVIANSKVDDYETETPPSKKNRTSRLFTTTTTTTTTIPQYIRRSDDDNPVLTQKDINVSSSDYVEDELIDHLQRHTTKMPFNKNLDSSSEENNDEVVPSLKYYDEISPENAFSGRHIEEVSSEDYYDDQYREIEPTTTPPDSSSLLLLPNTNPTRATTTTTTTPYTVNPFITTLATNIPIFAQFDASLLTTLAPLPPLPPPQSQTQTILSTTTTSRTASSLAAAIPDKKGKQIPIINTVPLVTTTTVTSSRRRLMPHEQLRNYIEDAYIRMPLAVIVDPSAESLERTKTLWNDALRSDLNIKIVLVTLNESHESPAAFNFNNTRQFLNGLNSIKEQNSGDAFRGISHAAELVPYDSAVFISTAQLAKHTDQVQDSAITLLKKRIRLYLIWFGERSLSENETQDSVGGILGEVAIRSGGEILHILSSENSQELEGSTLTIVADALRGSHEVDVPVDTTLSSLHVKIDKLMRRAVLETPNGDINLKKLVKFKTQNTFDDGGERLDAYVPLTKLRKATIYRLKVTPEDLTAEYSVFIRGERKSDAFLDDMIKHFETYLIEGHTSYPDRPRSLRLQQRLKSYENDAPVYGHSKIQFPNENDKSLPKTEIETFSMEEIHHNTLNNEEHNVSSLMGSAAPQQKNSNILFRTNTKIEMGSHSQILIAPGMMGQLYFEVTNAGYETNYYNVQVIDEKRYLIRLIPQSLFLRPGQMSIVTVSVFVPQNTQGNTIDHITFSTTTSGTTTTNSLTVNLKIVTGIDVQDNIPPSISWTFGSRCEGVSSEFDSCSERFWNIYATAQDWQSGIMRLQATPAAGLIYTKSYTVGTTEPLKATYVASCCTNKVSLVAFDAAGNQRSHIIDVRELVLTEASIAAIVLGALLLILLIILLIAAIMWCCRRRKIVLDLPTYRSHSTRSME